MHTVLSIAGSDSGGGAGIQADLKTITCLGAYGMTVITAITAQNTTGVSGMEAVSQKLVAAQMDAVFTDIPPEAVKLGMIPTPELMEVICRKLTAHKAKNIVVDPVMQSAYGGADGPNPQRTTAAVGRYRYPQYPRGGDSKRRIYRVQKRYGGSGRTDCGVCFRGSSCKGRAFKRTGR